MLRSFLVLTSALLFSVPVTSALAQVSEEGDHVEEELPPGHPARASYAWGEGGEVESAVNAAASHRYGHIFLSAGVGLTIRTLIYVDTLNHCPDAGDPSCPLAPGYLQLRGAYFFEGDGDIQHGIGLGISTNLTGEGLVGNGPDGTPLGIDAFSAWTLVPGYHMRVWFADWIQVLARIGFGVTAAELPNLGFEIAGGAVLKFLAGLGFYGEVAFSTYFAADPHPLISFEAGFVVDYELLP